VNTASYITPEDGLNKRPKHVQVACLAYYIIIKIHWSCVDSYIHIFVFYLLSEMHIIKIQVGVQVTS
jgi:hypothetical protein